MNNDYNNQNQDPQNGQYNFNQGYNGNFSPYGPSDPYNQSPFFDPYQANRFMGLQRAASAKNFGIAALIFSILSFCLSPLIGLILGIMAIIRASSAEQMLGGYPCPDTKLARKLGIASIIIVSVIFVISVVAGILLAMLLPEFFFVYP